MPEEGRWCGDAGEVTIFFLEIDLASAYISKTVAQRSGDLQTEKHHAALGMTANMLCDSQRPTSLTPLCYIMRSQRELDKRSRGNQKKTAPLCEIALHDRHFA